MSSIRRVIVIQNEQGLHARPAEMFVRTAKQFDAAIAEDRNDARLHKGKAAGITDEVRAGVHHDQVIAPGQWWQLPGHARDVTGMANRSDNSVHQF